MISPAGWEIAAFPRPSESWPSESTGATAMRHCKTISAAMVAPSFLLISFLLAGQSWAQWNYPPTRTVDVTDTYFGKTYADPYRWLENTKDKEVEDWFKAQAIVTDNVLDKIPARHALAREYMELDKLQPASYSSIGLENGRAFYKKTLGGENVGKLYF